MRMRKGPNFFDESIKEIAKEKIKYLDTMYFV